VKIGVVGAGHIGGTAAKLFARAGHSVAVSNSRGPASLAALVGSMGPNSKATTPEDAVKFGDTVLLAIPYRKMDQLPAAGLFTGKIVIDAMNPYSAVGRVMELGDSTSSEEVAKRLPGARIVKAFNTMGWNTLASGSRPASEDRLVVFLAGDDAAAKSTVAKLVDDIGFASIDTGSLRDGGRRQQPGSPVYGRPLGFREAQSILARRP
jgi:8-hydroxy-5-deazaflavin:NADPH oxidoreductase